MTTDWPLVTIDEIKASSPSSIAIGPFGSRMKSDRYVKGGGDAIPVIRGNNLSDTKALKGEFVYVNAETANELRSANVFPDDLVFPHRGLIGQVGIVPAKDRSRYVLSTSLMKLTCDAAIADPLFVFYSFRSPFGKQQLLQHASQVGTPGIATPLTSLRSIRMLLPPLPEQRAIAHILSTLDDKIDLNRQTNQTLEHIAAALFKSWFVDFDPVRAKAASRQPEGMDAETAALFPDRLIDSEIGQIPEGWQVVPVGEAVTAVGGSTPPTVQAEYWGGDIPFATPKDLSKLDAPVILATERQVTYAGLARISSGLIPRHSLLMSSRAPIGYLAVNEVPVSVNQGMLVMVCDQGVSPWFMLGWARTNSEEIVGRANGTTFLEISKRNFRPIPVVLPPRPILDLFDSVVEPLFSRLTSNLKQNQTLGNLRDTLLPRLLSGELRVPADLLDEETRPMPTPPEPALTQRHF